MSDNYVILDCDGGSDDAWALIFLLKAHEKKLVNFLGVTICGNGNTDSRNAAYNMLRVLKACGHLEIPVYVGAEESVSLHGGFDRSVLFHGLDGFGDILPPDETVNLDKMVQKTHAVIFIKETLMKYPQKVTLICVGPCTNLALCYSMYGSDLSKHIRELHLMGGNIQGVGNVTRSAEFNFYADPEAASVVLSKSKCPITILPWETCIGESFNMDMQWRLETLHQHSNTKHPVLEIMDVVEEKQYSRRPHQSWIPCDALSVAAFVFGKKFILTQTNWHAAVDLTGQYTRGQMVLDHKKQEPQNCRILEVLDEEFLKLVVAWSVGYIDDIDV